MSGFSPFPPALTLRSPILLNPSTSQIPPLDDLIALEQELKAVHAKTVARAKKAESDIKLLDIVWRKVVKAREKNRLPAKGKGKDISRIKREGSGKKILLLSVVYAHSDSLYILFMS